MTIKKMMVPLVVSVSLFIVWSVFGNQKNEGVGSFLNV